MHRPLARALAAALTIFALVGGALTARAGIRTHAHRTAAARVIVLGPGAERAAARHGTVRARLSIVGGVSATVRAGELDALSSERGVSRVVRDARVRQNASPIPTLPAALYPVDDDVLRSYEWGYDGHGVGIAIIDSGVRAGADFGTRLVQVQLPGRTETVDDTNGHGTLVAGIAAGSSPDGRYKGIAPGATVYGINVGRAGGLYSSDVISGLQWVLDNAHAYNIRVVNLSVSETSSSSYKTSVLDLAVERVWASGTAVVVAAGNTGKTAPADYAPANDPLVITVGGMDDKGTLKLSDDDVASFSAGGLIGSLKTVDGFAKPEILASGRLVPSVLAPGTVLASQAPAANRVEPGYVKISGTSFAAPQVAGAAAIVFQQHPDWSPDQVKYALIDRARTVQSGSIVQLDVGATVNVNYPIGAANQGVAALVCHPGSTCLTGPGTVASTWTSSTWTSSTWTSSTWTSSTWTSSTWTSSTWTSSTWTSSTWTGASGWSYMTWS
jgi:serine protease AprX